MGTKQRVSNGAEKLDAPNGTKNDAANGGEVVKRGLPRGMKIAMMVTFLFTTGTTTIIPYMQSRRDELGCDALCQGSMMSMRAGLGLVGSAVLGRASDYCGRIKILWVGIFGVLGALAINATMDNMVGHFAAAAVAALLNQNYPISKALYCDYIDESPDATDAERVDAVGKLGMTAGLALLVGPGVAISLGCNYFQAVALGAVLVIVSSLGLLFVPAPKRQVKDVEGSLSEFIKLPVLKTRGAQAIMLLRMFMALAFNLYMPISQVSVTRRFNFGPSDYAKTMGLIGISYALSQGLIARPLINATGKDSTKLLMVCMIIIGGVRPFALHTPSVTVMQSLSMLMIIALGVANTAITTASYGLVDADQVGGFLGVLEGVEQGSGILGPAFGGLLAKSSFEDATLCAVLCCYFLAFLVVGIFFKTHVFEVVQMRAQSASKADGKKDR